MTPALKAMVEAMDAAYECERCGKLTAPINLCLCAKPSWIKASTANAARAGLAAIPAWDKDTAQAAQIAYGRMMTGVDQLDCSPLEAASRAAIGAILKEDSHG